MNSGILKGVWSSKTGQVFAVGTLGTVVRYDNGKWYFTDSGTESTLNAVWGASDTAVFAVGNQGSILYFDGTKWLSSNAGTTATLYDIWGTSETNIYASGADGVLLHFDGAAWHTISSGIDTSIKGIWGNSAEDIFAVGANGMILHYDGIKWTSTQITPHWNFSGVWGTSGSDVYAVGTEVIMHFDGRQWRRIGGDGAHVNSVRAVAGNVFAAGQSFYSKAGVILTYDGTRWHEMPLPTQAPIHKLWGLSPTHLYAVGGDMATGEIILHYDGDAWRIVWQNPEKQSAHLRGVWGTSDQNVLAVGSNGVILRFDGSQWELMETPVSTDLNSIWGRSETDITAAGSQGVLLHYDGTAWHIEKSGTQEDLQYVWGGVETPDGEETVFAVGKNGVILYKDNQIWEAMDSGVKSALLAAGGHGFNDMFAVGEDDTILHFDGENWTPWNLQATGARFRNFWTYPGQSLVITGAPGIFLRYNGLNWQPFETVFDANSLYGIWARSEQEMYIAASNGIIQYYNGNSWQQMNSGTESVIYDIWGNTAGNQSPMTLFAVGENGVILTYTALTFLLPDGINEGETVQGEIIVRDAPAHDVEIRLDANRSDEITFPSSIVLAAGQTRTTFDLTATDDALLDGSQTVILSASADGRNPGQFTLPVHDNEFASLSVTLPQELVEGDGLMSGQGRVTLNTAAEKDVTVSLTNSDVNAVRLPETVVIKAGEQTAVFDIQVVDDTEINDPRSSTVQVEVSGWETGSTAVEVIDNDRYGIFLNIPETISEADGIRSGAGEIFVSEPFETDTTVHLSSGDPSQLIVPESVVIPAGQKSVRFDLLPVADMRVDYVQTVTVSTSARGFIGDKAEIEVTDADGRWAIQRFGTANFRGVWGSASDDIFAVGWYGCILHFDGAEWKRMESTLEYDGSSADLRGIWGNAADDVFAVGNSGTIIHFDGAMWQKMESNSDAIIYGVWGSSGDNVFAAGYDDGRGVILHYDGRQWQTVHDDLAERLKGIWGASAHDIFAIGDDGFILHYDGNEWKQMESGTDANFRSVWGSSATDVYIVTSDLILHYNGIEWQALPEGEGKSLYVVWGSGKDDVLISGNKGILLHFNGLEWTEIETGMSETLWSLWWDPENDFVGAGTDGVIYRIDGENLRIQKKTDLNLNDMWGVPDEFDAGDIVFTVGEDGMILECRGTDCRQIERGFFPELNGVWGRSESEVYAVGNEGVILKYNGERWRPMHNAYKINLNDVWGMPSDAETTDVFAVGDNGLILQFNGLEWQPMPSGVSVDLESIWGVCEEAGRPFQLFATGDDGVILRFKDGKWQTMESGTGNKLLSVWGTAPDHLYAVGYRGTFLRYNGFSWQSAGDQFSSTLKKIWGRSENDFFILDFSRVVHFDGFQWTRYTTPGVQLNAVWKNRLGDALAAGWNNTLYSFSPARLSLPEQAAENGVLPENSGCISLDAPRETDTPVRLASHHTSLSVPEEVVIPAGETGVCFDISLNDDALLNGSRRIPVTAALSGYQMGTQFIEVTDDETALLSLSLPDSVTEGDTVSGEQCQVSVDRAVDEAVDVRLSCSTPEAVRLPDYVTLPAGGRSASFEMTVVDDHLFNGLREVVISASVAGWSEASSAVAVSDDETRILSIDFHETVLESDGNLTARLTIPGMLDTDLMVSLSSDDVSEITLPEMAVIPAGETTVSVPVTIIDDPDIDGDQTVVITAEAPGWTSAAHELTVADNDPGELSFASELFMAWESDGKAGIEVIRSQSLNGEVSIDYSTSDGDAGDGIDILSTSGTLVFKEGESRKTFEVSFPATSGVSGIKKIGLKLGNPAGNVAVGSIPEAELVIVDQMGWNTPASVSGSRFTDVWGSSRSHVVAVGWHGLVYIYDGQVWSDKGMDIGNNVYLEGVWARSEKEIYIAGQIDQKGVVFYYNGETFSPMPKEDPGYLYDIWGTPDGRTLFAVGSNGVYRYIDDVWQSAGPSGLPVLRSIWGRAGDDVFAAGDDGTMLHYNGAEWQQIDTGTDAHLYAVWADERSETAFAAGSFGTLLHYDGQTWQPMTLSGDTVLFLKALWGGSASDVFAAGFNGAVFHFNGQEWQPVNTGTADTINALWGPVGGAALSVYGVDEAGRILQYAPAE